MEFGQTKFREIDLFDFMSFFGLDFLKFSKSAVCLRSNPVALYLGLVY